MAISQVPFYRANVTDAQQAAMESQYDDSANRFFWFNGREAQQAETKAIRANDLQQQANGDVGQPSDAQRVVRGSTIIGSHNDKYSRFSEPGKA